MNKKLIVIASAMATTLATSSASALQFDGFLTSGAAWHDDENKNRYIGAQGDRGIQNDASFETDSRYGLQISSDIAKDMSVVSQLLGTGVNGNFNAIVEWAYVNYKPTKWLSIHTGKIKQPVYLVNDYVEVGYAYPWIRPPSEVYYLNNPINTVNGIEFLMQFPIGPGILSFQPYVGSNRADVPNSNGAGYFEAEKIRGIDVKYSGRGFAAHASSFACEVKLYGDFYPENTPFKIDLNGDGKCEVNSVGFNVDKANVVIYAEAQKRLTNGTLSRPFGDQESYYGTLGYRFGKWMPHVTYASITGKASLETDAAGNFAVTCADGIGVACGGNLSIMNFPVAIQTSLTYGLRYELNDSAALKIEHSIVDVEQDPTVLAEANQGINFGLFDTSFTNAAPTEKVGVTSIALDVVF